MSWRVWLVSLGILLGCYVLSLAAAEASLEQTTPGDGRPVQEGGTTALTLPPPRIARTDEAPARPLALPPALRPEQRPGAGPAPRVLLIPERGVPRLHTHLPERACSQPPAARPASFGLAAVILGAGGQLLSGQSL